MIEVMLLSDFGMTDDKDFSEKRYFDVAVILATVFVETVL
jgi:hypothetical protein